VKKKEKEIKENRDFLENIFDTSLDGIYVTSSRGLINMVNKSAEKMLGYSKDELIGKHAKELSPGGKEYEEEGIDFIRKLHEEGAVGERERILLRKDGSLINIEQSAVFLKDIEGNLTGSMSSFRDVTERKRTEETLRKSEVKYQSLIEHANDAIISINKEGIIIGFNKKAEQMFGYSREEILGKHATSLAPPPQIEEQRKMLKMFKAGNIFKIDKKVMEGSGLRKDGQEFHAEFSYYLSSWSWHLSKQGSSYHLYAGPHLHNQPNDLS